MVRERLLIIGAGPVGLCMADALRQESIAYDHVDANAGLGGNWHDGVFETTHIVSSKGTTAFADYPMPADYPDFPSAPQMLAYLEAFARDRGIADGIEYNKTVVHAGPNPDDSWTVRFEDGEERTYKGVVVCNGHHWARRWPDIPGAFSGEYIHSKDYHRPDQLRDKRVLVIGAGNSAHDVACEAARVGKMCDLSLRSGYWFLPKTAFGRPLTDLPIWWMPVFAQRIALRAIIWATIGDYRRYGLKWPDHKIFDRHPTYGTDLLNYLRQGLVHPRAQIERFDGQTVHFRDGTCSDYDMVVAATGFTYEFPFLPDGLVEVDGDAVQLYGGAFPANVKNLYIVGASQPRGGFGRPLTPAAKLYARMIRLQDEVEPPLGVVLKWRRYKPQKTQFVDTESARRQIWLANRVLPLLKWQAKRMVEKGVTWERWTAPTTTGESADATAAAAARAAKQDAA